VILSCVISTLWISLGYFSASLIETQETPENIKGYHYNPEPAAGDGIRNGILLQLLFQPKFRRSNSKLSVLTDISIVTVLCFRIFDNLAPVQFLGFQIKGILEYYVFCVVPIQNYCLNL
jgi:hypothetical protein